MKSIFKMLMNLVLKKHRGAFLLISMICLSIFIFIFDLVTYQNQLTVQQNQCYQYIDEFEGKLNKKKIEQIEDINEKYQNNMSDKLIQQYQQGIINDETYIKKQNQLTKLLDKQEGFHLFYKQYLSVKANSSLEICKHDILSILTMCDYDYIFLFVVLFMIYIVFLKDYDEKTIIYEKITVLGKKYSRSCKILIYILIIFVYLVSTYFFKLLLLSSYIDLNYSVYNLSWISQQTIPISIIQYYIICIMLMFIGGILLALVAIFFNMKIKNAPLVLIFIFSISFVLKAFLGNDTILLWLPFVSFMIPGCYFSGIGETMEAFDINILLILVLISLLMLCFSLKWKKTICLGLICVSLISGCDYKKHIHIDETYNSYLSRGFSDSEKYIYFNNRLIDKYDYNVYSIYRDPLDHNQNLKNISVFDNHIIYTSNNEMSEKNIYYLDLKEMETKRIKSISSQQRNYLDINYNESRITLEDYQVQIIGDKEDYIYVYDNRIVDKNGNELVKGDFSICFSVYKNYIYSLQKNNQIYRYSLEDFKMKKIDTVLCDYFFIYQGRILCHGLKDQKIYEKKNLLVNTKVENFDISNDLIFYTESESRHVYSYNLNTAEINNQLKEIAYYIRISDDDHCLYYTTENNNNVALKIYDFQNKQVKFCLDD